MRKKQGLIYPLVSVAAQIGDNSRYDKNDQGWREGKGAVQDYKRQKEAPGIAPGELHSAAGHYQKRFLSSGIHT